MTSCHGLKMRTLDDKRRQISPVIIRLFDFHNCRLAMTVAFFIAPQTNSQQFFVRKILFSFLVETLYLCPLKKSYSYEKYKIKHTQL